MRGLRFLLLAMLAVMALPVAAAQADATWTGTVSSDWSDAGNWTGTPPASNTPAGTLTFPDLGGCTTCYPSNNDLSGVSATGLAFSNASNQYSITGNSLTLGSGGVADTGDVHSSDIVASTAHPVARSQTWSVGSS